MLILFFVVLLQRVYKVHMSGMHKTRAHGRRGDYFLYGGD